MPRAANPRQDWPPGFCARNALALYRAATSLASPGVAAWFALNDRTRPLLARLHPRKPPGLANHPVWVHACSVGEVNTARPLLRAIERRWPDLPLLLTVSTPTGYALAETVAGTPLTWFPIDAARTVRRFYRNIQPRALLLVETELWPNVLAEAHRTGVPVGLVNGRISDTRERAYRRTASFWRPLLRPLAALAVQDERSAERLAGLGARHQRITVTGNIKFDAVDATIDLEARSALRQDLHLPPDAPVVVFGSTRPGDEALAAACWAKLANRFPDARLIVAPRHLDRLDEAIAPFQHWDVVRRSEFAAGNDAQRNARILFLDTHGELARVYSIATVAVIGGSFFPGVEGHNPIEPAAQGVATVFGPHMRNFRDVAGALLNQAGASRVAAPEALCDTLVRLLENEREREELGRRARETVLGNQGAVKRTLDAIAPLLAQDRT